MALLIINGPNLNLLGTREPNIYGLQTMDAYLESLINRYPNLTLDYFQSNHEGEIIDMLQEAGNYEGIILNAGAYTHTSLAIADAIRSISVPVIEVHISNVAKREEIRHTSLIAPACLGTIAGLGMDSYGLAIEYFLGKER